MPQTRLQTDRIDLIQMHDWRPNEGLIKGVNVNGNEIITLERSSPLPLLGADKVRLRVVANESNINGSIIIANQDFRLLLSELVSVGPPKACNLSSSLPCFIV